MDKRLQSLLVLPTQMVMSNVRRIGQNQVWGLRTVIRRDKASKVAANNFQTLFTP